MFDYFYGAQAEQFAFYRVPKVLFTNDRFKYLSAEAKTLYGILLDRVPLSAKNGWIDEQGRVYIICTIEEIMEDMNCGNKKAIQLLSDLEEKVGLIERKRQGLGKPNLIYVKNFISVDSPVERHFLKCQKDTEIRLILLILSIVIPIPSIPTEVSGKEAKRCGSELTMRSISENLSSWIIFSRIGHLIRIPFRLWSISWLMYAAPQEKAFVSIGKICRSKS